MRDGAETSCHTPVIRYLGKGNRMHLSLPSRSATRKVSGDKVMPSVPHLAPSVWSSDSKVPPTTSGTSEVPSIAATSCTAVRDEREGACKPAPMWLSTLETCGLNVGRQYRPVLGSLSMAGLRHGPGGFLQTAGQSLPPAPPAGSPAVVKAVSFPALGYWALLGFQHQAPAGLRSPCILLWFNRSPGAGPFGSLH